MSNLNQSIIQGNLTDNPKIMGGEKKVARFTLASNIGSGDFKETTFVECVAFGKQVPIIETHLKKGQQITVRGQLVMNKWEDAEGNKRSKLEIRLENFNGFFFNGNKESNSPVTATVSEVEPDDSGKLF